jgi:hypothetical protein
MVKILKKKVNSDKYFDTEGVLFKHTSKIVLGKIHSSKTKT